MKVRIRKSAITVDMWFIDTKPWWAFRWQVIDSTWGVGSQERAMVIAANIARPTIIRVKP